MSSANKTLKTSDITVFPYTANKSFVIASSSLSASGIIIYSGINIPFSTTGSYPQSGLYYRSARHLYYSNDLTNLNTPNPISYQSYDELVEDQQVGKKVKTTLIYDNYLQSTATSGSSELDYRKDFPTASNAVIKILSIPTSLYGEFIKPQTFSIKETGSLFNIVDDGNGNLIESGSTTHVGNLIYSHGLAAITNASYQNFYTCSFNVAFNSNLTIYQSQVRCHINENEFNTTLNPSALSGSFGDYNANVTGSDFHPYATAVGLYNGANELIAVGKLAQPFPMPSNTDVTFVVKWDS